MLDLTVDQLLTTTRSVRKRLDFSRPVEPEIVRECLEIALQTPTGGNRQEWQFVVVTDVQKRQAIGNFYRKSYARYRVEAVEAAKLLVNQPERAQRAARLSRRAQRYDRYQQVVTLYEQGLGFAEITRRVGLSRRTIERWIKAGEFPAAKRRRKRRSAFDPYAEYVLSRWEQGCTNGCSFGRRSRRKDIKDLPKPSIDI